MKLKVIVLVIVSLLLIVCLFVIDLNMGECKDLFEGFNCVMWNINYNYFDFYVVKLVVIGWRDYVLSFIKIGLVNVVNNLDELVSFVNCLLEGEVKKVMIYFNCFWINFVFGIGGLIDWVSKIFDLKFDNGNCEFGEMFGYYGVGIGVYIMVLGYGLIIL